ncbi:transcription factor TFIIIB subunit brf1 [Cichlidogyrus casuarinus]|uniref:Transcription factor TFIIIB subunit brf1 n=1 Tax=Cichlidogyrus casuarinus TaxID=1844966 RepID=A0ABD2Q6H7_9PLAT
MKCPQCGSTDFDEDRARADVICLGCGFVVGENAISNEVEFVETAGGAAAAVGRFVSDESQLNENKASRAITEANARKRIETICGQLRLTGDVITSAFRFYQSALFRGLTKGKTSIRLAAACVYLATRQLKVNLMLLDLSDAVCVNVYALSATFSELKRKLNLVIPEMDPCLLIERFAAQLEFGDKTLAVSSTAMRLLQRMQKDWISVGRRPSGLCAAALLVAARIHEFNRTEEDVCRIARIGLHTTKKRLSEFSKTASSALTIDNFFTVDYEEEEDPPAFTEAMKKSELPNKIDEKSIEKISEEINTLGRRIDDELAELAAKRTSRGFMGSLTKLGLDKSEGIDVLLKEQEISQEPEASTSMSPSKSTRANIEKTLNREVLKGVLQGVVEPDLLDSCVDDLHLVTTCTGDNLCNLITSVEQLRDYQDEVDSAGEMDQKKTPDDLKDLELKPELRLPVILASAKNENTEKLPDLPVNTELNLDGIDDNEIENVGPLKTV